MYGYIVYLVKEYVRIRIPAYPYRAWDGLPFGSPPVHQLTSSADLVWNQTTPNKTHHDQKDCNMIPACAESMLTSTRFLVATAGSHEPKQSGAQITPWLPFLLCAAPISLTSPKPLLDHNTNQCWIQTNSLKLSRAIVTLDTIG